MKHPNVVAALGIALFACGGGAEVTSAPSTPTSASAPSPAEASSQVTAPASSQAATDAAAPPASGAPSEQAADADAGVADPPKRIGARHVLIQWMGADRAGAGVLRTREQALAVANDVLRRARAGEDLGRLAVEYSDEPNAGGRGGSLGRFGHGQMVPAFEAAAFKLRVGEISDIVETPFGFHIIQRTE